MAARAASKLHLNRCARPETNLPGLLAYEMWRGREEDELFMLLGSLGRWDRRKRGRNDLNFGSRVGMGGRVHDGLYEG